MNPYRSLVRAGDHAHAAALDGCGIERHPDAKAEVVKVRIPEGFVLMPRHLFGIARRLAHHMAPAVDLGIGVQFEKLEREPAAVLPEDGVLQGRKVISRTNDLRDAIA